MIYNYGRGVPKDATQAIAWYKKAAAQGDPSAMLELGEIYSHERRPEQEVLLCLNQQGMG